MGSVLRTEQAAVAPLRGLKEMQIATCQPLPAQEPFLAGKALCLMGGHVFRSGWSRDGQIIGSGSRRYSSLLTSHSSLTDAKPAP